MPYGNSQASYAGAATSSPNATSTPAPTYFPYQSSHHLGYPSTAQVAYASATQATQPQQPQQQAAETSASSGWPNNYYAGLYGNANVAAMAAAAVAYAANSTSA